MKAIMGYLVFVDMGNGCLSSKYGNTTAEGVFPESALRIGELDTEDQLGFYSSDPFAGKYLTTWIKDTNETQSAHLIIKRRPADVLVQYRLIWHEPGNPSKVLYYGEGMLYGNILIASYWNPAVHTFLDPGGSKF